MMRKSDWQSREKKRLEDYLKLYNSGDWQKVVTEGNILISMGLQNDVLSETIGKAYFNLGDFTLAKKYLAKMTETNSAQKAEKYWLMGTADNQLKNYMGACQNFNIARQALSSLECIKDIGKAAKNRELWAQPGFKANILAQHAVNEMLCGDIEAAVRDYKDASDNAITLRDKCECYSSYLMTMHNRQKYEQDVYAAACQYNEIFSAVSSYKHDGKQRRRKLRIGYISPDFRRHVMFYFYYALFLAYSRDDFEVYAYYLGRRKDKFTALVQKQADKWIPLGECNYAESAARIYADEIDILVDLGGHSVNGALPVLAYKPAPIQISGLGYMGTTGLQAVDYLITDKVCDPPEAPRKITEKPLYIPSLFCYIGRSDVPLSRGTPALTKGYVTFGVFNRYNKISAEMLGGWQKIQAAVVDSCFYFKSAAYADPLLAQKIREQLRQAGFVMDRVILEPADDDYMEKYLSVDIALDTYPYTGGGTTCDALYMGVPVITLTGRSRSSKFSASILTAAGLTELVAHDMDEYVRLAVAMASNMAVLQDLHIALRGMLQNSLLMDVEHYVQAVECEYHRLWDEYEKKAGK